MPEIRLTALLHSFNLLLGFLAIACVGHGLVHLLAASSLRKLRPIPVMGYLLVGQVGICTIFYFRSMLSHVSRITTGVSLPITPLEMWGIAAALLCATIISGYKKSQISTLRSLPHALRSAALEVGVLWIAFLGISLMELPREIMLSSDPDLHAYWASQVGRVGEVPWNQGLWGMDRFSYPAGFAVLNYVWSVFSLLSVPTVVTTQPLLQTQLSLALIAWTACLFTGGKSPASCTHTLLFAQLMMIYYSLLPFGYQHNHFHLEGTGRLSAGLLATACLTSSILFMREVVRGAVSVWGATLYTLFNGLTLALLTFINPGVVLISGCFVALGTMTYLVMVSNDPWYRRSLALLGFFLPLAEVVLGDPYYYDLINGPGGAVAAPEGAALTVNHVFELIITSAHSFASSPLTSLMKFIVLDLLSAETTQWVFAAALVAYLVSAAYAWWRKKRFDVTDGILIVLITCAWMIHSLILVPIALALAGHGPARLLHPYLMQSVQQNMFIILCLCFALILSRLALYLRWWISLLVVLALLKPMVALRAASDMVNLKSRYQYSGSMGDLTADDSKVIAFIEEFSGSIFAKYPNLNARTVPKILIPNEPLILGNEKWLFSGGGARVLPFKKTLPVAFYYSQGDSRDYSWASYKQRVCEGLDRSWMLTRNIRYVFLPTQLGGPCSRALKSAVRQKDILFQSGDAIFATIVD